MKAFKLAVCILALLLCFSGCSCEKNDSAKGESDTQNTAQPSVTTSEAINDIKSSDKAEEKDAEAKNADVKLYYATQAEGELNTSYHTKDCKATEGLSVMEINSDFVTMIGLNPCSKCNPPKF